MIPQSLSERYFDWVIVVRDRTGFITSKMARVLARIGGNLTFLCSCAIKVFSFHFEFMNNNISDMLNICN